jgi:hypothetical protein
MDALKIWNCHTRSAKTPAFYENITLQMICKVIQLQGEAIPRGCKVLLIECKSFQIKCNPGFTKGKVKHKNCKAYVTQYEAFKLFCKVITIESKAMLPYCKAYSSICKDCFKIYLF